MDIQLDAGFDDLLAEDLLGVAAHVHDHVAGYAEQVKAGAVNLGGGVECHAEKNRFKRYRIDELTNRYSADEADRKLVPLVAVVLAADAEVLHPGVVAVGATLLTGPVIGIMEFVALVGEQERLFAPRRQFAALLDRPGLGSLPIALGELAGQQDQVMRGLALCEDHAGIVLALVEGREDEGDRLGKGALQGFGKFPVSSP